MAKQAITKGCLLMFGIGVTPMQCVPCCLWLLRMANVSITQQPLAGQCQCSLVRPCISVAKPMASTVWLIG
jgi:hypothetical protein